MNKENMAYIHSGSVLTKEQTETIYEFAKVPIEDFEKLGYTHEESMELAKAAIQPITINPAINWDEIVEAFNSIGCTSFRMTSEEIEKILERSNNEH